MSFLYINAFYMSIKHHGVRTEKKHSFNEGSRAFPRKEMP